MLRRALRSSVRRSWQRCSSSYASPIEGFPRDGAMWKQQLDVPRLPVPALDDTCQRYLDYLEPLLSETEHYNTSIMVGEFASGEGLLLQHELEQLDREAVPREGSYVSGFWDSMYRELRCRQPVNTTPYLLLANDARRADAVSRSALLLRGLATHRQQVLNCTLTVDLERGAPLDMRQYELLYGTARIPAAGRDRITVCRESTHVVVMRRNRFYPLDIAEPRTHAPRAEQDIAADLRAILRHADQLPPARPLGAMTAGERDQWAALRQQLCDASVTNRESIDTIDRAIYMLALDEDVPPDADALGKALLTGAENNRGPVRSRWWDKQQLIVLPDGSAASLLEHTPVDGHVSLGLFNMIDNLSKSSDPITTTETKTGQVRELQFEWNPELTAAAEAEENSFREFSNGVDHATLRFDRFGASLAKSAGMSPDAFVQQMFQIAYFKQHGTTQSTYEAANMKNFMAGRTETIRSVTMESQILQNVWDAERVEFEDGDKPALIVDDAMRLTTLRDACAAHATRAKEAKAGFGVDRHLYALRELAVAKQRRLSEYEMPSIFQDGAFSKLSTSVISTSNVSAPFFDLFGFGAVCPDGIGLAYNVSNDWINFSFTSFTGQAQGFKGALLETLEEVEELIKEEKK